MRDVPPGLLVTVSLVALFTGCADGRSPGTADCEAQVRHAGTVFTARAATDVAPGGTPVEVEQSRCDDLSSDSIGSYFPDQPDTVTARSVVGYDAEEVLAVEIGETGTWQVYVADSTAQTRTDRILARIGHR